MDPMVFFSELRTFVQWTAEEELRITIVAGMLPPETARDRQRRQQQERLRQEMIERGREIAKASKRRPVKRQVVKRSTGKGSKKTS